MKKINEIVTSTEKPQERAKRKAVTFGSFKRAEEKQIEETKKRKQDEELTRIVEEARIKQAIQERNARIDREIREEEERVIKEEAKRKRSEFITESISNAFGTKTEVDYKPVREKVIEQYLPQLREQETLDDLPKPFEAEPALNAELEEFKKKINEHIHKVGFASGGGGIDPNKISDHLIPTVDNTFDLGAADRQWRNLYLSGSTLIVDGTSIDSGELTALDGVTAGTVTASKAVIVDANKDITGFRNVSLSTDASVLSFGTNSEVTLTHVHDTGLTLTHTATGDNTPIVLQLKSEEDDIVADEVIASLEFAAGDSDGTDGATVAAGIHAIAEGTFSSSANATKLVFTTGVSETAAASATAKMTLSSAGLLTIADDFVIKDGGTIGAASSTSAITIASTGIVTFVDDILIKDGGTIGVASATTAITIASSGIVTFVDDILIKDAGTIGSASDPDAIAIAANGVVTFSQAPVFPDGSIDIADINLDGGTDIGAAIVDDDLFLIDDGADGTMRKTAASRLKTYIGAGAADDLQAGDAAVTLTTTSGNITIDAQANDSDIIFKGTDGGADTTFLTIDGSTAGKATFNDEIVSGAVITSGAGLVIADDGNIGSASDTDAIAIAANGVVTFSQVPVLPNDTVETNDIQDNAVTPAKIAGAVNAQTGTTYTLVLADAFKTVTSSNGSAQTITIPLNSSVAFATGDRVDIVMLGSGTTSVTGASGVTVNGVNGGTGAISAQYAAVSCLKIASDTWILMGNHGGVS